MAPCIVSRVDILLSCVVIVSGYSTSDTTTTSSDSTTTTSSDTTTTTSTDMPWGHAWWVWLALCLLHCITCCICHAVCIGGVKAYRSTSRSKSSRELFADPELLQYDIVDEETTPASSCQHAPLMKAAGPEDYYGPSSARESYGPPSAYS
mmetsp:Transcript_68059/g.127101  ORF Transcript_68059/g.127101 Transcript_68059/m.127101 type:complete len:150 (+) Transcript_68059:96-545(+)